MHNNHLKNGCIHYNSIIASKTRSCIKNWKGKTNCLWYLRNRLSRDSPSYDGKQQTVLWFCAKLSVVLSPITFLAHRIFVLNSFLRYLLYSHSLIFSLFSLTFISTFFKNFVMDRLMDCYFYYYSTCNKVRGISNNKQNKNISIFCFSREIVVHLDTVRLHLVLKLFVSHGEMENARTKNVLFVTWNPT